MLKFCSLIILVAFLQSEVSAQQQLLNGGFENWENAGNKLEPVGWNGLMSARICSFCSFGASQRVFKDKKEARTGDYCVRIESTSVLGGVVVNGSLTTGQIVAMSLSPSAGYTQTVLDDTKFQLPIQSKPDSVVFRAKYSIMDASDSALVSFLLHDDYEMTDPPKEHNSYQLTSKAVSVFQTNGTWQRISVPFKYVNSSKDANYLLATFSSSVVPGKGNSSAKLWVDDVELIYNDSRTNSIVQN